MTILAPPQQTRAFRWIVLVLALAALATLAPFWVPLVLAAWIATLARPLFWRVSKALGRRGRAAAVFVAALVVLLTVPVALAIVSLASGATSLAKGVMGSSGAKGALVSLVSGGGESGGGAQLDVLKSPEKIVTLVREHGQQAFEILGGIAGAATAVVIGLFVFLYAVYVFLVDGPDYYAWVERHLPIHPAHTERFAAAFTETGRGLLVGVGLTGLVQGAVATVAYVALGVPRALVLGLLTCLASVIPSVGTALVWVPVAAGLALAGKTGSAIILGVVGVAVVSSVDNVLRPVFARYGKLQLSSFVLLVAIFGGLVLFGTWGIILGPLFVRLAKEGLTIARHDRLHEKRREIDEARAERAEEETTEASGAENAGGIGPGEERFEVAHGRRNALLDESTS